MRKLIRPLEPHELQVNKVILTKEYKEKSTIAVWRKDYIVEPLYNSSSRKCAYCENTLVWKRGQHDFFIELNEDNQLNTTIASGENNFLHIDHFVAKKYDADKVVEWTNLVPSCPTCNYKKGAFDVVKYPIINPYEDDPKEYFIFSECTLNVKCSIDNDSQSKASKTIALFSFIDRMHPVISNLNLAIQKSLDKLRKEVNHVIEEYKKGDNSLFNDNHESLKRLLESGLPSSSYGAFIATIILKHSYFGFIKERLTQNGLWGNDLIQLENQLKEISYE